MSLKYLWLGVIFALGLPAIVAFPLQPCLAQVATPAPMGAATTGESTNSRESIDDIPLIFLLDEANDAYDNKNFLRASLLLQRALMNSESDEEERNFKGLLASTLVNNAEFLDALHLLNDLAKSKSDSSLTLMQAETLLQAGWRDAALDQLRVGLRLNPNNLPFRKSLAGALFSSPVSTGADAAEALTALLPLEAGITQDPRIAGAIAMAAAGAGDFELAVKMHKRYAESLDPTSRQHEAETLSRYEAKHFARPVSFPKSNPAKILSNQEIAKIAHQSMVLVRVKREMDLMENKSGENVGSSSTKHTHVGTVLSSMGTILVNSETVRMPRFDEFVHGTEGSVKLTSERIEVFTMPNDVGISESLGLARVQGIDEPSGLAVIEFIHEKHFENVQYEELKTIQFIPEYRLLDPNTKKNLADLFEYSVEKGNEANVPSLRELTSDLSQYSAYHDRTIEGPTMAKLPSVQGSEGPVGTPVYNQLGECVGLTRKVGFNDANRTVIIPSAVCTRIAAKLMADGVVHRTSLPIVVSGMLTGVQEPRMGMLVQNVTSKDPIYKSLEGTTIVTADGTATPTMTEWLMVLERAYALGSEAVGVEIYDPKDKSTSCISLSVEP